MKEEGEYLDPKYNNALVVSLRNTNTWVKRILIDIWSSTNILHYNVIQKIDLSSKYLNSISSTFTSFMKKSITMIEIINIYVTFGPNNHTKIVKLKFLMVDFPSTYNSIIGRLTLN